MKCSFENVFSENSRCRYVFDWFCFIMFSPCPYPWFVGLFSLLRPPVLDSLMTFNDSRHSLVSSNQLPLLLVLSRNSSLSHLFGFSSLLSFSLCRIIVTVTGHVPFSSHWDSPWWVFCLLMFICSFEIGLFNVFVDLVCRFYHNTLAGVGTIKWLVQLTLQSRLASPASLHLYLPLCHNLTEI